MLLVALALRVALHLPAAAPPLTTFGGHLTHAPAGDTVRLTLGRRRAKAPLSPSGDFQFEFKDLAAPTAVEFEYAGQHTRGYLTPGDQLRLTLDFNDFDKTLTYSGRGADANNYLAQSLYKFEYGPPADGPRPADALRAAAPPAEVRRLTDAYRQSQLAFLAAYAQAHPLPAAFRQAAEFRISLQWATQRLAGLAQARRAAPAGPTPPAADFTFLKEVPLRELNRRFGPEIGENTAIVQFLALYATRLSATGHLSADPAEGPRLYQLATAELGNNHVRDLAMELLIFNETQDNLPGVLAFYPTFRQHNPDSATARALRRRLAARQMANTGQPAPNFTLLDNTGKSVSLSDFKGKVVYLDFWGTWCHPCMNEMTDFAPALKKQFEGRDVVFLYISVGDPVAKWQQVLAERHFTGPGSVHLRATSTYQAETYQVVGYPSYYPIGRDGRFIQLHATRPSQGAITVAAIEEALRQ